MTMFFEGADIDLGPLWSGKGISLRLRRPVLQRRLLSVLGELPRRPALGELPEAGVQLDHHRVPQHSDRFGRRDTRGIRASEVQAQGDGGVGFLLLALRTVSPFAIVLPLYLTYIRIGLFDTYLGMSLAYLVIDVPVVVWMLSGFFREVPGSIYEAAESSGASETQIFWRIALPSVAVGIAATVIFAFVLIWNEFLMASLLTGAATKTVSLGVWSGVGEAFGGLQSADWDAINAAGTLAFVPAFALILLVRRYLAKGFSLATAG